MKRLLVCAKQGLLKMLKPFYNLIINHFWFENSIEFFLASFIFLYQRHEFDNGVHIFKGNYTTYSEALFLAVVALLCLVYAWVPQKDHKPWLENVTIVVTQFTATALFLYFIFSALSAPMLTPDSMIATVYAGVVVLRIFMHVVTPLVIMHNLNQGGNCHVNDRH